MMHGLSVVLILMGLSAPVVATSETSSRFSQYKPIYGLPAHWTSASDDLRAKYQVSFKLHAFEGDVGGVPINFYFANTETVFWALYSSSSPILETVFHPEFILRWDDVIFRKIQLSLIDHESTGSGGNSGARDADGRTGSRGWNRTSVELKVVDRDAGSLTCKVWLRSWWAWSIGRSTRGIEDFRKADIVLFLARDKGGVEDFISGSLALRPGLKKQGNIELNLAVKYLPLLPQLLNLKWLGVSSHVQFWHGYGEGLLEYDERTTSAGLGFSIYK
jgi:phospholipase A1/A2